MSHVSTHRQVAKDDQWHQKRILDRWFERSQDSEKLKNWQSKREIKGILLPRFWDSNAVVAGERSGCVDNACEIPTGVAPGK